jgi:lipoprotein-releasing system permease protein
MAKTGKIKFYFWLSVKLLFNKKTMFGGSGPLSMLGLILGVAALVASQSVMRGFEATMAKAVIDMSADIQVVKRGRLIDSWPEFQKEILATDTSIQKVLRYAHTEAVVASKGKVSGVLVQGLDMEEVPGVLKFESRFTQGGMPQGQNQIAIGTGLAKKLNINIGDKIYIAVPLSTPFESTSLQRSAEEFSVSGILDMGKNDWNERLVISHLKDLQRLTQIGDRYNGAFIKISDSHQAVAVSSRMASSLEPKYYVNNWYNLNRNILEAASLEKIVIFFVVFLIVIMAAFNISSTLYVIIRSRYKDIAILKTLGFGAKSIRNIFVMQGFAVGTLGTFGGFVVGLLLSYGFMWLQARFSVLPGAVYKIDRIDIQISAIDFIAIYISTLAACIMAAYYPAKKGSELLIIEGMKQD